MPREIPRGEKYCGNCACLLRIPGWCQKYDVAPFQRTNETGGIIEGYERAPICIEDDAMKKLAKAKDRIDLLEQFVKASDKYMGQHLTHWTVCNKVQIKEAECTCGADELMTLREKIRDRG